MGATGEEVEAGDVTGLDINKTFSSSSAARQEDAAAMGPARKSSSHLEATAPSPPPVGTK